MSLTHRISMLERRFVMAVWVVALVLCCVPVHAQGIIMIDDHLQWSPVTLLMCIIGWFLSWSSDWVGVYNKERQCLTSYISDHLARIVTGCVTMGACYILLPELAASMGFEVKLNNFGAFVVGLCSDVIVARIRAMMPKKAPPSPGGDDPSPPEGT